MIGEVVNHKVFGRGSVVGIDEKYITVSFENKSSSEKKFLFPEIFETFLSFDNEALNEDIKKRLLALRKERGDYPHGKTAEESALLKEKMKRLLILRKQQNNTK